MNLNSPNNEKSVGLSINMPKIKRRRIKKSLSIILNLKKKEVTKNGFKAIINVNRADVVLKNILRYLRKVFIVEFNQKTNYQKKK